RKSTGRILNIEGDLKLQILPKLAITAGKVSMNNPEGFDRQVFAEFDDAFFRIRLVPLLSRKIDIKKMVVNGLKVHLIRSKDGRMNWKGFRASPRASDQRTIPLHLENLSAGRAVLANSPLAMLFAMKLDIFGAEVTYADEMTGINIKVEDLEFIIDRFGLGREIDFKIQGNLTNSKPVFHESALIGGRIYVNEELNNIKVNDFKWTSKLDSEFLSDYFKQAELTATAEIDLAKNTFSTTGLRLTSGQTSLGANLFATRIFEKPNLDGQVSIERAHPARILELMGLQYIGKDPSTFSSLSGNFGLALNQSRLLLKDITLVLDGNPLRGVASLAGLESPEIKFNLSAERLEADRYLTESGALPIHFKSRVPSAAPSTEG
ncbi:MAG: AsmA family protein, partial [Methylococcales bacterium]